MYLSGYRVDMQWRSGLCALSTIFLLGPILRELYSRGLGHVEINEKMASEVTDKLIIYPSSRDYIGSKADFHLPFCLCWGSCG